VIKEALEALYKSYYGENQIIPCRCGVACENEYLLSKPKIVFALKEPHTSQSEIDITSCLERQIKRGLEGHPFERGWSYTWVQAGIWAYAIHNGFKSYRELRKPLYEAQGLQTIGIINLKKSGGGSSAIRSVISKRAKLEETLWKKELELLRPDLIICGNTYNDIVEDLVLPKMPLLKTKDFFYHYSKWNYGDNTSILLQFWHPGRRGDRDRTLKTLNLLVNRLKKNEPLMANNPNNFEKNTIPRVKKKGPPIIRLTRWESTISLPRKGNKAPQDNGYTTIYGVDAEGHERVYAQVPSEQWKEWSKTDSMWKVAHAAMIRHWLSDPRTRDGVILIHIEAALKKGDDKTAFDLWNALSESTRAEIMTKRKDQ
jgi:hypothetical protein